MVMGTGNLMLFDELSKCSKTITIFSPGSDMTTGILLLLLLNIDLGMHNQSLIWVTVGFDHGLPCRVRTWPEGLVMAWDTMIKSYSSTPTEWFFSCFVHRNVNFSTSKCAILWLTSWLLGKRTVSCYGLVVKRHKRIIFVKTWTPAWLD